MLTHKDKETIITSYMKSHAGELSTISNFYRQFHVQKALSTVSLPPTNSTLQERIREHSAIQQLYPNFTFKEIAQDKTFPYIDMVWCPRRYTLATEYFMSPIYYRVKVEEYESEQQVPIYDKLSPSQFPEVITKLQENCTEINQFYLQEVKPYHTKYNLLANLVLHAVGANLDDVSYDNANGLLWLNGEYTDIPVEINLFPAGLYKSKIRFFVNDSCIADFTQELTVSLTEIVDLNNPIVDTVAMIMHKLEIIQQAIDKTPI